jgi:hypothetical protein
MKKIYFSLIAAAALTSATAQNVRPIAKLSEPANVAARNFEPTTITNLPTNSEVAAKTSATVIVTDTNWYFVNKHEYRNTATNANSFYTYKIAPTYTGNSINSGGAYFAQTGNMIVGGAEGIVIRQATAPSANVPVGLYLFNALGGMPTGNALASCTTAINSTTIGNYVGCNFSSTVLVTGDFAIIIKNVSSNPLDSIRLFMNNARTMTANISPAAPEQKFGESYGLIGYGATTNTFATTSWDNTTDLFTLAPPNTGSDFEFCVAPRVAYAFTANHAATTLTTCNTAAVLYPNTTSANALSRQWNLNRFYKLWQPFANTALLTGTATVRDSAVTWNFGDGITDYSDSPNHSFNPSAAQAPPPTYTANLSNTLLIKLQKMDNYFPGVNTVTDSKAWSVTVTICNVGLTENSLNTTVGVYPNPATDKVTVFVNNANQDTQLQVLNALGQVVITRSNLTEKNELNTESLSKGVYFVRVGSGKSFTTTKLIISK